MLANFKWNDDLAKNRTRTLNRVGNSFRAPAKRDKKLIKRGFRATYVRRKEKGVQGHTPRPGDDEIGDSAFEMRVTYFALFRLLHDIATSRRPVAQCGPPLATHAYSENLTPNDC